MSRFNLQSAILLVEFNFEAQNLDVDISTANFRFLLKKVVLICTDKENHTYTKKPTVNREPDNHVFKCFI